MHPTILAQCTQNQTKCFLKRKQSAGDDGSTQALKPIGRFNRSPKQRVPVAPQNGDLSPQKNFKKERKSR